MKDNGESCAIKYLQLEVVFSGIQHYLDCFVMKTNLNYEKLYKFMFYAIVIVGEFEKFFNIKYT